MKEIVEVVACCSLFIALAIGTMGIVLIREMIAACASRGRWGGWDRRGGG